jgi:hypothetical protein
MAGRCTTLWLFDWFAWNVAEVATFAVSKAISSEQVLQRIVRHPRLGRGHTGRHSQNDIHSINPNADDNRRQR